MSDSTFPEIWTCLEEQPWGDFVYVVRLCAGCRSRAPAEWLGGACGRCEFLETKP